MPSNKLLYIILKILFNKYTMLGTTGNGSKKFAALLLNNHHSQQECKTFLDLPGTTKSEYKMQPPPLAILDLLSQI